MIVFSDHLRDTGHTEIIRNFPYQRAQNIHENSIRSTNTKAQNKSLEKEQMN